jgi:hypothetical protein
MKILIDTLTPDQLKQFSELTENEQEFVALVGATYLNVEGTKSLGVHFPMELGLKLLEAMKKTEIINSLV